MISRIGRIILTLALSLATVSPLLALEGAAADDAGSELDPAVSQEGAAASVPARNPTDIAIARSIFPESDPSLAINPANPQRLVVGLYDTGAGDRCAVTVSANGGTSWSSSILLPLINSSSCFSVDVAYTPDGGHLYAAYNALGTGVLVSASEDDGHTWSEPKLVINLPSGYSNPEPTIVTQRREDGGATIYVAVAAYTDNNTFLDTAILLARSADGGKTWDTPRELDHGRFASNSQVGVFVDRPKIAGGMGGELLLAWVVEEWFASPQDIRSEIRVRRSADYGGRFDPIAVAAAGKEPFVGLFSVDVKIGHRGAAHLAYDQHRFGEDTSIRYVWSARPPYRSWAAPVTVNDDRGPHIKGRPALQAQRCGDVTLLHLIWVDTRNTDPIPDEIGSYDIYYAQKAAKPGASWSRNVRVSDVSSRYQAVFDPPTGPIDLAMSGGQPLAVWTDRRNAPNVWDYSDIFGSRIRSGKKCP